MLKQEESLFQWEKYNVYHPQLNSPELLNLLLHMMEMMINSLQIPLTIFTITLQFYLELSQLVDL